MVAMRWGKIKAEPVEVKHVDIFKCWTCGKAETPFIYSDFVWWKVSVSDVYLGLVSVSLNCWFWWQCAWERCVLREGGGGATGTGKVPAPLRTITDTNRGRKGRAEGGEAEGGREGALVRVDDPLRNDFTGLVSPVLGFAGWWTWMKQTWGEVTWCTQYTHTQVYVRQG